MNFLKVLEDFKKALQRFPILVCCSICFMSAKLLKLFSVYFQTVRSMNVNYLKWQDFYVHFAVVYKLSTIYLVLQ